ncbi:MFS transporter [Anaerospora hongkongensis]|uniref:MFS transporter n=1 Tax=Anaerospora hongkongensis TaxID=244830 RepID=UPI00289EB2C5|nr:MFS transporter [Anaerospora hongkongensis]
MNIRGVEVTHKQLAILFVVWLAFLLSFVDRLSWPPIMPVAIKELGMSAKEAGSYMTSFYFGYVLTQLPGGLLTDRFGYRKVLLSSFLIMGFFTGLMGVTANYEQGLVFRFLAGVGSGAVFSASVRAIFDWFPANGRGTAMGFFMTASSLGLSVVNLFVPVVAKQYNWKVSFFVAAGITIAAFAIGYFLLEERKTDTASQPRSSPNFWKDILSLTKNRDLILTGIAGFGGMWATWGIAAWSNTYMNKELHLSLVQAGAIMSTYGIAALVCKPISGFLADYFQNKKRVLIFGMIFSMVPLLILLGMNKNVEMLYVLMPLLGIAAFVWSPIINLVVGEVVPPHLVGTATGFANTIWQLGSLVSPMAVGAVLDATNSYLYAFATLAVGPMVGAFIILLVKDRKQ